MGRRRTSLAFALLGLSLVSCQTITEEMPAGPAGPSGVGSPPPGVVVVPVVLPSPTAPAPAPNPGGGGTPTPAPTAAPPNAQGCSLPRGSGSGNSCPRQSPTFLREVEAAIDEVVRSEPGLFNKNKTSGCGTCYEVQDWTRYAQRVAQAVQRNGVCATYDGEELAVKNTNSFNDQFDILTAGGFIRRELGSYRSTCYPAWF